MCLLVDGGQKVGLQEGLAARGGDAALVGHEVGGDALEAVRDVLARHLGAALELRGREEGVKVFGMGILEIEPSVRGGERRAARRALLGLTAHESGLEQNLHRKTQPWRKTR